MIVALRKSRKYHILFVSLAFFSLNDEGFSQHKYWGEKKVMQVKHIYPFLSILKNSKGYGKALWSC